MPIYVFDLLMRNFEHETPVNSDVLKYTIISVTRTYTMTISSHMLYCDIECFKQASHEWIQTDHPAIQRCSCK